MRLTRCIHGRLVSNCFSIMCAVIRRIDVKRNNYEKYHLFHVVISSKTCTFVPKYDYS